MPLLVHKVNYFLNMLSQVWAMAILLNPKFDVFYFAHISACYNKLDKCFTDEKVDHISNHKSIVDPLSYATCRLCSSKQRSLFSG